MWCMLRRVRPLQAADSSVAAREHAARAANQLYTQAADQAAVARDQAAQALGEGIDRVRRLPTVSPSQGLQLAWSRARRDCLPWV